MNDERIYIQHMFDCVGRIEAYTVSGYAAFEGDTMMQDAVMRALWDLRGLTPPIEIGGCYRNPA